MLWNCAILKLWTKIRSHFETEIMTGEKMSYKLNISLCRLAVNEIIYRIIDVSAKSRNKKACPRPFSMSMLWLDQENL